MTPHVVRLHYVVKAPEGITYDNPPPVTLQQEEFELELSGGLAVATMLVHYATREKAQSVVDPVLRAWEIESSLGAFGRPQLSFEFHRADTIDRSPPPAGTSQTLGLPSLSSTAAMWAPAVQTTLRRYPALPTIRVNADVETLWFRYSLYKSGRDSITGMGYFCFSYLLWLANGAAAAGRTFSVDDEVLDTLSRLTSGVGDKTTARKRQRKMDWRAHTEQELQWIDGTVRMLIRRLGEHAAGAPLQKLTMADLPPVS